MPAVDPNLDLSYNTPQDIQNAQYQSYQDEMNNPRATSVSRGFANINRGMQLFMGGGPQVSQAQATQAQMSSILQQANEGADPNEDPLSRSLRIARLASTSFADTNPQMALKANAMVQQLTQAQQQQKLLSLKTQEAGNEEQESDLKLKMAKAAGGIVLAIPGQKDANGLPTEAAPYATIMADDPDYNNKLAAATAAAQKDGVQVMPMSISDFQNGKLQNSVARGQFAMAAAQQRAQAEIQAAMIRAQQNGQKLSGQSAQMTYNVLTAADLGSTAIQNVMNMPLGSAQGVLGWGKKPGESILQSSVDSMRGELTTQDQQRLSIGLTGLSRNLAMIEMTGRVQGQATFADGLATQIEPRIGDTRETFLTRLAEAKQVMNRGTDVFLNLPGLDPKIKDIVQKSLDQMNTAMPYTVNDITNFLQGKNHKQTFQEYGSSLGLGAAAKADGLAPDGAVGMVVNGKNVRVKPADMAAFKQEYPNATPLTAPVAPTAARAAPVPGIE